MPKHTVKDLLEATDRLTRNNHKISINQDNINSYSSDLSLVCSFTRNIIKAIKESGVENADLSSL